MPPRLTLTDDERELLPELLEQFAELQHQFPRRASAPEQAGWIRECYSVNVPLTDNLTTLLLFEHGVHRSLDQVRQDLAILREDT